MSDGKTVPIEWHKTLYAETARADAAEAEVRRLRAALARAEAERQGLLGIQERDRQSIVALREAAEKLGRSRDTYANDLTEALKLRDKLREALTCWGVHDAGCPGKSEGPDYCTCGLDAARSPAKAEPPRERAEAFLTAGEPVSGVLAWDRNAKAETPAAPVVASGATCKTCNGSREVPTARYLEGGRPDFEPCPACTPPAATTQANDGGLIRLLPTVPRAPAATPTDYVAIMAEGAELARAFREGPKREVQTGAATTQCDGEDCVLRAGHAGPHTLFGAATMQAAVCRVCNGSGAPPNTEYASCLACGGSGRDGGR